MIHRVLSHLQASRSRHLEELTAYLTSPSIAADPAYREGTIMAAEQTAQWLREAGMNSVQLYPTPGSPVVLAEWRKAPNRPTLLIYGHYDVQPVDPIDLWHSPPFEPAIVDDRIIARGSADDKGQLFMHIKAIEAWLATTGELPINILFLVEGEEESGSPHLGQWLQEHKSMLTANWAMVSDTSMWAEGVPSITYGLRGIAEWEIEVIGPNRDLHSGLFGGTVANPLEAIAQLLAGCKDDQGRITIPGFYDEVLPLTEKERAILDQVPFNENNYRQTLEVKALRGEQGYTPLERIGSRPTLEINGLWGGYQGAGFKTVLPSRAHAKLSARLVPNQDPQKIRELVKNYLLAQTIPGIQTHVTFGPGGGKPFLIAPDHPAIVAACQGLSESFAHEVVLIREGASIPIVAEFREVLNLDTLLIGFALPDSRVHSPNENLHLPTFYQGIEALARIYTTLSTL